METIGIVEVQCLTLADVQVQFRQKFDEDRKTIPWMADLQLQGCRFTCF